MIRKDSIKKILGIILASLLLLTGCSSSDSSAVVTPTATAEVNKVEINSTIADMSGYENMPVVGHQFREITPSEFVRIMAEGVTGYFYFGFHTCPFCNKATSVLNEAAVDEDVTIYYIDVHPDVEADNFDDDMDAVLNSLSPVLSNDEDGNPEFFVPHLFVVKDGEIIDDHVSLVDSYKGEGVALTTKQHTELVGIYKDMIEELK